MPLINSMGVLRDMTTSSGSSANQLWFSAYGANIPLNALGLKVLGNYVYVYGAAFVIKINPFTGSIVWYKIFSTLTGDIRDVAVDASDNVYLGVVNGTATTTIIKLDSTGAFVSGIIYGSGLSPNFIINIVVDPVNDFLYFSTSNSSGTFGVLVQIDITTMTTVWKKRVQPPSGTIITRSIVLDSLGDVYVCYSAGRIVKFDSSGTVVWAYTKTGTAANKMIIHNDVLYCYSGGNASATNIVSVNTSTGSCITSLASTSFTNIQGVTINTDGNICVLYSATSGPSKKLTMTTSGTVLSNITFSGTTSTFYLGNSTNDYNINLGSDYGFTYVICLLTSGTVGYYGIVKLQNNGNYPLNTPFSFVVNGSGTLAGNIVSATSSFPTVTTPTVPTVTSITMTISTITSTETAATDSTSTDVPAQYKVTLI